MRLRAWILLATFLGACRDPVVQPRMDAAPDEPAQVSDAMDAARPDVAPELDAAFDAAFDAFDAAADAAVDGPDARDAAPDALDARLDAADAGGDARADAADAMLDVPVGDAGLSPAAMPERRVTCGPRRGTALVTPGAADRFVLRGRIVTPTVVHDRGEVLVVADRIACVGVSCATHAMYAGSTVVETAGLIYPGLIDAHSHVSYNWLPPWTPPRLFGNRYQWAAVASYDAFVQPYRDNEGAHECAMAKYGEVRSLVSGATTIQGGPNRTCIRTLVRNPEYGYDFGGVDRHRTNVLGISTVTGTALTTLQRELRDGTTTAYIIHLSEGVDERSRAEFDELETKMLLTPATVVIHGTAFGAPEAMRYGAARAKLVWSPRSNVILYGATTNVPALLDAGTVVALGADWTPSGGPNMLSELRYARYVAQRLWPGRLTSRDLVEMATTRAAVAMDRATSIGAIAVGLYADLTVIPDTGCDPYDSLIDAPAVDVALVFVGGRPMYGDAALMDAMPAAARANCEPVAFCGVDKRVCVSRGPTAPDGTNQTLRDIEAEIRAFYPTPYPLVPLCP